LAATIQRNFELPDMSLTAVIHAGKRFVIGSEEWLPGNRVLIPWGVLCGNHSFYNSGIVPFVDKVLYIIRHPIPTMMSYWRFMDPLCLNNHDMYLSEQRIEFWRRHVMGFIQNCKWVRYEDLISEKHDEILDKIGKWFNLKPNREFTRVKEIVGWTSDKKPIQPKQPNEILMKRFSKVFPDGILGYGVDNAY
jgi:hypothetical protein